MILNTLKPVLTKHITIMQSLIQIKYELVIRIMVIAIFNTFTNSNSCLTRRVENSNIIVIRLTNLHLHGALIALHTRI